MNGHRVPSLTMLLSLAALVGCGGKVVWDGSGSGSPARHETPIAAYADATPIWCSEWRKPIPGIKVFSSYADGSVLDEATSDASGQASLLTIEGGYASAAWPGSDVLPEIQTYAVTAGMPSIEFSFVSNHTCNPLPMHVHVDATPFAAQNPFVRVCGAWCCQLRCRA